MNNTVSEMKTTLEGVNSRLDDTEDHISDFEDKVGETTQSEHQKKKIKKMKIVRDLRDNMKCNNIHGLEIPEGEEREQGIENLFEEIVTENFPNLVKK